jgi:hypothetical protein
VVLGVRPPRRFDPACARGAWRPLALGFRGRAGPYQLTLGGLVGSALGALLVSANGLTIRQAAPFLAGVVLLMLTAVLVAAVGPARRGLRIQPMEALEEEVAEGGTSVLLDPSSDLVYDITSIK